MNTKHDMGLSCVTIKVVFLENPESFLQKYTVKDVLHTFQATILPVNYGFAILSHTFRLWRHYANATFAFYYDEKVILVRVMIKLHVL